MVQKAHFVYSVVIVTFMRQYPSDSEFYAWFFVILGTYLGIYPKIHKLKFNRTAQFVFYIHSS